MDQFLIFKRAKIGPIFNFSAYIYIYIYMCEVLGGGQFEVKICEFGGGVRLFLPGGALK